MRLRAAQWVLAAVLTVGLAGGAAGVPDAAKAGGQKPTPISHKARQVRPIQLGTSGGSAQDIANGYCCSGTLGALVQDVYGIQYILSNTHVFAGDSVSGGNGIVAQVGDPVNQPGFVDVNCANISQDYVATLSDWVALVPGGSGTVDAAIAEAMPGAVDPSGKILEIGAISAQPMAASLGQLVKKSGRTSGLTRGKVAGINATVTVQYTNECAGTMFKTKFTNQILVSPGKFLQSGDSGSLLVQDVATNPRAIGLLYAGGGNTAVANPIGDVLTALDVTLVGAAGTGVSAVNALAADVEKASKAQNRNERVLANVPSYVGHAVGLKSGAPSKVVVKVLVEELTPAVEAATPKEVDGVPVEIWEVGPIIAY